nr:glycerophosphodiester phosphodiesterase family protein [Nocardioides daphniae]
MLLARHENELSRTTDVASVRRFARRRRVGSVDGKTQRGWFTEDFTVAEVKRLTARERKPRLRPANTLYDGREGVPTLDEVLAMASAEGARRGRTVGLLLELKTPTHFAGLGLDLVDPLLTALRRHGLDTAVSDVAVMAFETGVLRRVAQRSRVAVVQLLGAAHRRPWDLKVAGDRRTYGDLASPEGLAWVDEYADGLGATKELVLPVTETGAHAAPTPLVAEAHRLGLTVHVWTLRAENRFLPPALRAYDDTSTTGDMAAEVRAFLAAGVDGVITDHPDIAVVARDAFAPAAAERRGEQAR